MPITRSSSLKPVVGKAATKLEKARGLRTVGDLLDFLPRRYLDASKSGRLADFHPGEDAVLVATIVSAQTRPMRGRKGKIQVAVSAVDRTCQISFADGGPGIPSEIRQKIFTPFFTTKARGSGLGLPTARRLVEAHDGEITVECPPSGGTSFLVRLPM